MVHSMVLPLIIQIDNVLVITNERTSANGGGRSEGLRPTKEADQKVDMT